MNIVEPILRRALTAPEAPAIISGERVLSYGALMRDVAAVSSRLSEEGVQRGDVVALVSEGLAGHILTTLAIARIGAASVPFSHMHPQEMTSFAQACGAAYLVYNGPEAPAVEADCLRGRLGLRELGATLPRSIVPMVHAEPDELFRIAFSSGTTGRQKPVKFSHHNMALRSHLMRIVFPSVRGERTMVGTPVGLHFSLGYILRSLLSGGTLVDCGESIAATAAAIRTHKVTLLLTSPGDAVQLVKFAQANVAYAEPPPQLQALCMGGARVAPALQALLRQHVCRNLYINYGMTEAGGLVAQADTALLQSHPTSAGRLMPWVEMEAVDDRGNPLPLESYGRLRVRSPYVADGYIGIDPQVSDAFRDGWFYSGDLGMVTAEGLVFLGARSDVLNVGGTKVSAETIEAVIAEDPAILECAALMMPDRLLQEHLVVVVVSPQGFDAGALRQRCVNGLGATLVPTAVISLDELPHNAAGKIKRQELPALVARHLAAAAKPGPTPAS
jgi:acyl-coenzyme A synthetase/AMP-(fatty) acid ligase